MGATIKSLHLKLQFELQPQLQLPGDGRLAAGADHRTAGVKQRPEQPALLQPRLRRGCSKQQPDWVHELDRLRRTGDWRKPDQDN